MRRRKKVRAVIVLIITVTLLIFIRWNINKKVEQRQLRVRNKVEFFQTLAPYAEEEAKKHKLFASVILSQAALESNFAKSKLSREYNNYFGIKAIGNKKSVNLETFEYKEGVKVEEGANFRVYSSIKASFKDYGNLVGKAKRYEPLRAAKTVEEAARALYSCGYSTDPKYGDKLLTIMEENNLTQYDKP